MKPASVKNSDIKNSTSLPLSSQEEILTGELRQASLWFEKCALDEARSAYSRVYHAAEKAGLTRLMMEALSGELRMAAEACDADEVSKIEMRLEKVMKLHPEQIPSQVWYCKGVVAMFHKNYRLSQIYYHRYLKEIRIKKDQPPEEEFRVWITIANSFRQLDKLKTSKMIAERLVRDEVRFPKSTSRSALYLLLGKILEIQMDLLGALAWYQRAHSSALQEHNWYHYVYVLLAYARVCRLQGNERQAHGYLDLVEKVASTSSFGIVREIIDDERKQLEHNVPDLYIDGRRAVVKTKEGASVSLKKQYILLDILEALTEAHQRSDQESCRGLSKSELIEKVWGEHYRPEVHDNKLYYNINRLRKLIEKDTRNPQYLVSWKEGYQLSPEIRVEMKR